MLHPSDSNTVDFPPHTSCVFRKVIRRDKEMSHPCACWGVYFLCLAYMSLKVIPKVFSSPLNVFMWWFCKQRVYDWLESCRHKACMCKYAKMCTGGGGWGAGRGIPTGVYLSSIPKKKPVLLRWLSLLIFTPVLFFRLVDIGWKFPEIACSSQKKMEKALLNNMS